MDDIKKELLDFKQDADRRFQAMRTQIQDVIPILEKYSNDRSMEVLINLLNDLSLRLESLQEMPFGDRPPELLRLEERTFCNLINLITPRFEILCNLRNVAQAKKSTGQI